MSKPVKQYIPIGSDPLMEKFINCVMKQGKKSIARGIVADAFEIIKTRTKDPPSEVFSKALFNVTPLVEVRPKRIAGSVYQVPVEVNPKRQMALSIRWILDAARSRKGVP
ncbi:30S ribosomal protein S7, partial [Candidatus Peribacteria bacterium]|nr:30S ribosomal protein S7 [Candidatus Peribacteria bacterium]